MKTWFSMSVLDLLCAVPAFLIASSLHKTLMRNRPSTDTTFHNLSQPFLHTNALWTFGTASASLSGTGGTNVPEQSALLSKRYPISMVGEVELGSHHFLVTF